MNDSEHLEEIVVDFHQHESEEILIEDDEEMRFNKLEGIKECLVKAYYFSGIEEVDDLLDQAYTKVIEELKKIS